MRQTGFTLLEILVAVTVFGILYVMASVSLNTALDNRQHALASMERLAEVQVAVSMMGREMEQIVNRPIRNQYLETEGALEVGTSIDSAIDFTRTGHAIDGGLSLLRVSYGVKDEKLMRWYWDVLDRSVGTEPKELVLMEKVSSLLIECNFGDGWQQQRCSPPEPPPEGALPPLPAAIKFTIETKDWGNIHRVIRLVDNEVVDDDNNTN